jgi:hypothetical protein
MYVMQCCAIIDSELQIHLLMMVDIDKPAQGSKHSTA